MLVKRNSSLDVVLYGYIPRYARKSACFLRTHSCKILYYLIVIAALAVIAYAAEIYRNRPETPAQGANLQASAVSETPEVRRTSLAAMLPEDLQVLRGYSDAAQWNDLLCLWEAHPAIDFALPAAHALMHGTISECGMHPVYGGHIRINSGEFEIVYASLLPNPALSAGMQVRAGDYLGIPDSSMPSERHIGSHLHVEVMHNGKLQNLYTLQAESNLMD